MVKHRERETNSARLENETPIGKTRSTRRLASSHPPRSWKKSPISSFLPDPGQIRMPLDLNSRIGTKMRFKIVSFIGEWEYPEYPRLQGFSKASVAIRLDRKSGVLDLPESKAFLLIKFKYPIHFPFLALRFSIPLLIITSSSNISFFNLYLTCIFSF